MAYFILISSLLINLLFFFSGFHKITDFKQVTKGFMDKTHLPLIFSKLIIISVILLEIIAPFIISLSALTNSIKKIYTQIAILSLIGFTILATFLYHFPPYGGNYYSFMSNLSTIGGLMLLYYIN